MRKAVRVIGGVLCFLLMLACQNKKENAMIVKTLEIGPLQSNCYIVADEETNEAIIIDPGDEPDRVLEEAEGFKVRYIVLTHAHFDHTAAIPEIKEATGAEVMLHEADVEVYRSAPAHAASWGFQVDPLPEPDVLVGEGDEVLFGGLAFMVLHTPGHSPGSMCLYFEGMAFTGDTLFAGSVGRTDLPGGSMPQMRESFRRLMGLPDSTVVLPGHGPRSSIGREKAENMFSGEFLGWGRD